MKWTFLSHSWGPSCPSYGGGERIYFKNIKDIDSVSSSRLSEFKSTNHIGTHFDFPAHFGVSGNTVLDYKAEDFVYSPIHLFWLNVDHNVLITPEIIEDSCSNLSLEQRQAKLVLIRTGAGLYRTSESYWKSNPGLGLGTADYLRKLFPSLQAVGTDTISISSFSSREIGRIVHKEFLCHDKPLLLIEDMNLEVLTNKIPLEVIALPLRIEGADGAPCTVIARFL